MIGLYILLGLLLVNEGRKLFLAGRWAREDGASLAQIDRALHEMRMALLLHGDVVLNAAKNERLALQEFIDARFGTARDTAIQFNREAGDFHQRRGRELDEQFARLRELVTGIPEFLTQMHRGQMESLGQVDTNARLRQAQLTRILEDHRLAALGTRARHEMLALAFDAFVTAEKPRNEEMFRLLDGVALSSQLGEVLDMLDAWPVPAVEAAPVYGTSATRRPRDTVVASRAQVPEAQPAFPGHPRLGKAPAPGPVPVPELAVTNEAGGRLGGKRVLRHATRDHEWARETVQRGIEDLRSAYAQRGVHPTDEQLEAEVLNTLQEVEQ